MIKLDIDTYIQPISIQPHRFDPHKVSKHIANFQTTKSQDSGMFFWQCSVCFCFVYSKTHFSETSKNKSAHRYNHDLPHSPSRYQHPQLHYQNLWKDKWQKMEWHWWRWSSFSFFVWCVAWTFHLSLGHVSFSSKVQRQTLHGHIALPENLSNNRCPWNETSFFKENDHQISLDCNWSYCEVVRSSGEFLLADCRIVIMSSCCV